MKQISIPDWLHSDITEYCRLNGLKIGQFCSGILSDGLSVAKYGDTPFASYDNNISKEEEKASMVAVPDDMIMLPPIKNVPPESLIDKVQPGKHAEIIKKFEQEILSDTATPEKPAAKKLKRKLK